MAFFMEIQETIVYRLNIRNHDFRTYLKILNFWRENGRGRRPADGKGSAASKPDQKVGPLVEPFLVMWKWRSG